jgi:hypothetical protein
VRAERACTSTKAQDRLVPRRYGVITGLLSGLPFRDPPDEHFRSSLHFVDSTGIAYTVVDPDSHASGFLVSGIAHIVQPGSSCCALRQQFLARLAGQSQLLGRPSKAIDKLKVSFIWRPVPSTHVVDSRPQVHHNHCQCAHHRTMHLGPFECSLSILVA